MDDLRFNRHAPIVCLCGSTRFRDEFYRQTAIWTKTGHIVLSVGFFVHQEQVPGVTRLEKARLDVLHLRKIELADSVFVINVGGYVGESTEREIEYARSIGRKVFYLEHPDGIPKEVTR
jgi:hypothetical protein